jgi:hypothetical protein
VAAGQTFGLSPPEQVAPTDPTIRDPALAVLLAGLHQDSRRLSLEQIAELDEEDWHRLLAIAAAHKVQGLLGQRLSEASVAGFVPSDVRESLSEAARQTAARMLRAQTQLAELASAFDVASIPVMTLKGVHLAQVVYPNLTLRAIQDLDVLVSREHLQRATDIARTLGYVPKRPFDVELEAAAKSQGPQLRRPESLDIDLHWNITEPNEIYSIDPADLWTSAVHLECGGCRTLCLSPELLLLHLCTHASYHHGFEFGIRSFVDIAAAIQRFGKTLDWAVVQRQCRTWRWQRGVGVSLSLARELCGAAVPSTVLDSLSADTQGATIDRKVIDAARVHVLGGRQIYLQAESRNFAQLRALPGFWSKARQARDHLFLPRSEMARLQGQSLGMGRLVVRYLVRAWTLMGKYAPSALELLHGPRALPDATARRQRLRRWLSEG